MISGQFLKRNLKSIDLTYAFLCAAFFVMPLGTSPFTIAGLLTLSIWTFSGEFFRARHLYFQSPWFLPVALIVLLTWAGVTWSADPSGLGFKYAQKTYYWLYTLVAAAIAFSGKPLKPLLWAFLGGLLVNATVGLLQLLEIVPSFSPWGVKGLSGFYSGYNTLAILLVLGMLVASFLFKSASNLKSRFVLGFLIAVYFFQLSILESRSGYLVFLVLCPYLLFNLLPPKRRAFRVFLAYLLVASLLFASPIVRGRVSHLVFSLERHFTSGIEIASGKKFTDNTDRIYMWRWAFDLFMKHPLIGIGTGGYREALLAAGGDRAADHPHNNFLHIAVSFGILGIAAYGWLFWVLLRSGWTNRERLAGFFVLSSSLVILVGGLTDTHILDAGGAFLLAITAGVLPDPLQESDS